MSPTVRQLASGAELHRRAELEAAERRSALRADEPERLAVAVRHALACVADGGRGVLSFRWMRA